MSGKNPDMEQICEFCNKSFDKKIILRHIGKSEACKNHYGPRFKQMKTEQASARKEKWRRSLSFKEQRNVNKRARILYVKNTKLKEKNKQIYKELKIKKTKETEERRKELDDDTTVSSEEAFDGKILYKSAESICKIFEHKWVHCHFCKDRFDPHSILKHIGKTEACKAFYGSKFEDFKREKKKIKMRIYR